MDAHWTSERQVVSESTIRDREAAAAAAGAAVEDHTVAELRARLRDAGLPVSGTKDELIQRLADHEAAQQATADPTITSPEEED